MVLLGLFYLVIDVFGFKRWGFFFRVIGSNSIAVYMAASLFDFRQVSGIFLWGLSERLGAWNDFVQGVGGLLVIWLILYFLYRKKIFIRV